MKEALAASSRAKQTWSQGDGQHLVKGPTKLDGILGLVRHAIVRIEQQRCRSAACARVLTRKRPEVSSPPVPIGGLTALRFLREGDVGNGKRVLVYGASGSVGSFAVQLATHFGAHVTGLCSTSNVELVTSLGADEVVDYTKQDFTEAGPIYDIVFDAVGKGSPRRSKSVLTENGSYVSVRSSTAKERAEDLRVLGHLLEARKVRAIIDRRYTLEQIAEAHRYVEKGHKRGNEVITVGR
jgi:NADPH:quinone reductase-like Zn-dependent oxidoreductase